DQTVGVRELPARERVGRESRVDEGERAGQPLVRQIGVEAAELRRRQHPLVDERPRRAARDGELRSRRTLGDAPGDVELPLERVPLEAARGSDEELPDRGLEEERVRPGVAAVDGNV